MDQKFFTLLFQKEEIKSQKGNGHTTLIEK